VLCPGPRSLSPFPTHPRQGDASSAGGGGGKASLSKSRSLGSRLAKVGRMGEEEAHNAVARYCVEAKVADLTLAPRLALMSMGGAAPASADVKVRPLPWLIRLVEEMYDYRYQHVTNILHNQAKNEAAGGGGAVDDGSEGGAQGEDPASLFPLFVYTYLVKKHGASALCDSLCKDLIATVDDNRERHGEVELFSRFIGEEYDTEDMLFFLYVRSVTQKVLNVNLRARWASSELSGPERTPKEELCMSWRELCAIARAVFGADQTVMCRHFLVAVEEHVVGKRTTNPSGATTDTRRIEVMHFLQLAVHTYHERGSQADSHGGGGVGMADHHLDHQQQYEQDYAQEQAAYGRQEPTAHHEGREMVYEDEAYAGQGNETSMGSYGGYAQASPGQEEPRFEPAAAAQPPPPPPPPPGAAEFDDPGAALDAYLAQIAEDEVAIQEMRRT